MVEEVGVVERLPGTAPETRCEGRMPWKALCDVMVESGRVGGEKVLVLATGDVTFEVVRGGVKGHCEDAGGVMRLRSSKSA